MNKRKRFDLCSKEFPNQFSFEIETKLGFPFRTDYRAKGNPLFCFDESYSAFQIKKCLQMHYLHMQQVNNKPLKRIIFKYFKYILIKYDINGYQSMFAFRKI